MMNGVEKIKNKKKGMGKMSNVKAESLNKTRQYQISKFNNLFQLTSGILTFEV
jgi:hypothetical protein